MESSAEKEDGQQMFDKTAQEDLPGHTLDNKTYIIIPSTFHLLLAFLASASQTSITLLASTWYRALLWSATKKRSILSDI